MGKGTHFIGQPMFGQLISFIDKSKVLGFSREKGGERYVKHFDAWQHLVVMLYAVIKRFDSLREITDSMFPEARKLSHLGIGMMPRRSTLSDANARRPKTSSSRPTATCTPPTRASFPRTAESGRCRSGRAASRS